MAEDIYRRLQQQLDQYSMGFPQTASGIEIKILQYLFTEQEAQMFSLLTPMLQTARAVSARTAQPEEAEKIPADCREAGLVTQPATSRNPGGMCNCCGDCCGVLRALNKHPKPADLVFSNHFARVDADACTGCETCLDRCQMGALSVDDEDIARVDLDRCIGCGLCVSACPVEALTLVPKSGTDYRTPPESMADQMMHLARKRGVI